MKRDLQSRRQRPRGASSQQSKSESEDRAKKRAAPSRRGSLLATATRKDVPTRSGSGNIHAMPAGRTLGFFDKMLGLRISRHPSERASDTSVGDTNHNNNSTTITKTNNYPMPAPAPVDMMAKGWAGMPQTDNDSAAGLSGGNGEGGGSGRRAEPSGGRMPSSQGRRSGGGGSSNLGATFAAFLPWNRGGHHKHSSQQQQFSSLGSGGGGRGRGGRMGSFSSMSYASGTSEPSHFSASMGEAPRFAHPLYTLVESNKLEVADLTLPVTARDLNSVMDATATYVVECMRFYYGVQDLLLVSGPGAAASLDGHTSSNTSSSLSAGTAGAGASVTFANPLPLGGGGGGGGVPMPPRGTVMASENWETARQIMVLVPNYHGHSPLGIWSRSLCIDQGLRFGTMLPYIDTAYREGFAVIICTPALATPPTTSSSAPSSSSASSLSPLPPTTTAAPKELAASSTAPAPTAAAAAAASAAAAAASPPSLTPEELMAWVYDHLLTRAQAEHVVLVGYSHGARLCKALLHRALAHQQEQPGHAKPISTLALVESCRLKEKEGEDGPEMVAFLKQNTVNLKKSQHPIGRPLPDVAAAIGVGDCFSLGTTGPDMNLAWSLYQGMGEVFKYCQRRPPSVPEKKSPRLIRSFMGLMRSSGGNNNNKNNNGSSASSGGSLSQKAAAAAAAAAASRNSAAAAAAAAAASRGVSPSSFSSVASTGPTTTTTVVSQIGTVSTHPTSSVQDGGGTVAGLESVESGFGGEGESMLTGMEEQQMGVSGGGGLRRTDSWAALLDRKACMSVENFVLDRVIGKGAFGKVLMVRIRNDVSRRAYALKVINKCEIIRRGYVESTKLERRILCEADHPFLVHLRFAFQSAAKLYLVTDFYNGGNLLVHLKRNVVFTEPVARFFAAEVFLAIQYLHSRHIVYRDLKPENVLMESSGHVALTDFGLSKQLLGGVRTSTFCGTAEYLAPEQLRRAPYGTSVDWWAFGIFVYEMMVGRSPFYNRSRTSMYDRIVNEDPVFPPEMSPDALDLISLLLKKNPEERLGGMASEAIQHHPFFRGMDWELLASKDVAPLINPEITRASDCRYISSRYLNLEPHDTLAGDAGQRFTDFTFIGEDTYHRALAQNQYPSYNYLKQQQQQQQQQQLNVGRLPTVQAGMGGGRTDGSYTSGCSDVATWTSSSAHITTSGVVLSSRGAAAGAAGASYFGEEGMGGGGGGGGGSVTGASMHHGEVPSVAVLMTTGSNPGENSSSFNGGEVEAGMGGMRREGSNRSRPL